MMRRSFAFLPVLLCALFLVGCNGTVAPDEPDQAVDRPERPVVTVTAQQRHLIEADNTFGLKLFQYLSQAEGEANVFISPLSVSMALGMTLNGAEAETRTAMQQTLEVAGLSLDEVNTAYRALIDLLTTLDTDVSLDIANSIWHRDTFPVEAEFLDRNTTFFDAAVRALDFNNAAAPDIINAWVDEKTQGKIDRIVDGIDPTTMMFLINAVYFKGGWSYPFDETLTHDAAFNLADGSQKPVRMMTGGGRLPYTRHADFQAVDLPYGDSLFSMTIFLPREDLALDDFIAGLDAGAWSTWTEGLAPVKMDLLQLPRFKLEYDVSLKEALMAMGMEVAFDPQEANFGGINPDQGDLHISAVQHKTFVEVNEEGAEAAAVTSVVVGVTSVGQTPITMRVDRPFVFAIREQATGTILFIGKVTDPG